MAFAEAASDDGSLTRWFKPLRGFCCGSMTTAAWYRSHVAILDSGSNCYGHRRCDCGNRILVILELDPKAVYGICLFRAAFQVIIGGVLMFLVGIWIVSS